MEAVELAPEPLQSADAVLNRGVTVGLVPEGREDPLDFLSGDSVCGGDGGYAFRGPNHQALSVGLS